MTKPDRQLAPGDPTMLRDGDVVLQPLTAGAPIASDRAGDGALTAEPGDGVTAPVFGFVVRQAGRAVGTVEVRSRDGVGFLSWAVSADGPGGPRSPGSRGGSGGEDSTVASAAIRLVVDHAFSDLRLDRVETHVAEGDTASLRAAGRAGLRREGVMRGRRRDGAARRDIVVLGRLADDPGPGTREGLIGTINALLPTKRVIAHALIRDPDGRVLLCEQTIKPAWDLPGGVVDADESPMQAVVREVREELDLDLQVERLLAVNWLPRWGGWDDACVFLFDLGVHPAELIERMTLQASEIRAVHWCDPARVAQQAAVATATLLAEVASGDGSVRYLEDGRPVLP